MQYKFENIPKCWRVIFFVFTLGAHWLAWEFPSKCLTLPNKCMVAFFDTCNVCSTAKPPLPRFPHNPLAAKNKQLQMDLYISFGICKISRQCEIIGLERTIPKSERGEQHCFTLWGITSLLENTYFHAEQNFIRARNQWHIDASLSRCQHRFPFQTWINLWWFGGSFALWYIFLFYICWQEQH